MLGTIVALTGLAYASLSESEKKKLEDTITKIRADREKALEKLRASEIALLASGNAHQRAEAKIEQLKAKLQAVRRDLQKERRERKAERATLEAKNTKSTPPSKRTAKKKE